jgi:ribosomal protein S18 acetylase RimI-like enzyme
MNTISRELSDITIRTAGIDDLAQIFHLGERLFTPGALSNLYRTWDEYEVTALFNSDREYMLVADLDGTVVGFALGTIIEKERSPWSYGYLTWLGVDPDYARRGIASRLFDSFRQLMEAESVRMLMIDTQADNEAAVRFFERKGFRNPTDHVYMTLNLGTE